MNKHKNIVTTLILWGVIHLALLITGIAKRSGGFIDYWRSGQAWDYFYPFATAKHADLLIYDFTEFLVYLGIPVLAYILYLYNQPLKQK